MPRLKSALMDDLKEKIELCPYCGKEFHPYKNTSKQKQKTCGDKDCITKSRNQTFHESERDPVSCKICGKKFIPKNPNQKVCNDEHYSSCVICGKKFKITKAFNPPKTCGNKDCKYTLREITRVENIQKKNLEELLDVMKKDTKMEKKNTEDYKFTLADSTSLEEYPYGKISKGLIVVSARTGGGKTTFGLRSALEASQSGKSTLFISLEEPLKSLTIAVDRLSENVPCSECFNSIKILANKSLNIKDIKDKIESESKSYAGLDLVVIDSLQRLYEDGDRSEDALQKLKALKKLSQDLDISIMVLNQAPTPVFDDIMSNLKNALDNVDEAIVIDRNPMLSGSKKGVLIFRKIPITSLERSDKPPFNERLDKVLERKKMEDIDKALRNGILDAIKGLDNSESFLKQDTKADKEIFNAFKKIDNGLKKTLVGTAILSAGIGFLFAKRNKR